MLIGRMKKVRLYANGFYSYFFVGYGVKKYSENNTYTPNVNYTFNDDAIIMSTQRQFLRAVPTSERQYFAFFNVGKSVYRIPTWNFAWIRKANIMIDRITNLMPNILTTEEYNHWLGVGRFFRGLEYARLVNVFGDVPYYDREIKNTDLDELYKERTPRNQGDGCCS